MAIFKCDSCGYEREVPEKLLGKRAKCPDCGHGVTIVDTIQDDIDVFESVADEGKVLSDTQGKGPGIIASVSSSKTEGPIDLDTTDIDVDLTDSITCLHCGHIMPKGHTGVCTGCGQEVEQDDDYADVNEDDVDVSDLAEPSEPQVWDANYSGTDGVDGTVVEDDARDRTWNLFAGSLPLNVFAGLVSGVLAFFFAISMALLASTPEGVHDFLPFILASSLTGMAIGSVFFSLTSRIPFALAGPETVPTAMLFLFLGTLYSEMADAYPPEVILPTILATIALTAFCVGVGLWMLGKLKAGEFIRFIPVQIIGGVIGGVGVFVLFGAVSWMGSFVIDWNNLYAALKESVLQLQPAVSLYTMGPSILFGVILLLALRKFKNSFFLLVMILTASAVGYVAGGWGANDYVKSLAATMPYFENGIGMHPIAILKMDFGQIQWALIKAHSLYIGAVASLIILSTMYRVTLLEVIYGRECELNQEYRALGLANVISGLCVGMPVSLSYGRSSGNRASGARGPIAGIVAGLVCVAVLYFADYIVPLVPRFVPEGLLIYAGLDILRDWMFRARTAFTRSEDLWMLWMTFLITVVLGALMGIGFGVGLALMVTVCRYSKAGAVRNVLSGVNHRSNVDRAPAQQRTLKEFGDHIFILRLQGFLFLGSMQRLLMEIRTRLGDRDKLPVEYLLLDFKLVSGIASAAGIGFDKLHKLIEEYGIELIITSAPLELEEHLEKCGLVGDEEGSFKVFFNLDFALEWCENHVLDSENMLTMKSLTLPELLAPVFPEPKYIPALMKVLKRIVVAKGEAVFRQGDNSDSMYFVESGRLDVELELEGGKLLRLKKVGPGAVFGEMGIYTLAPRSATVRAAEKCVLYMMTTEKLDAIEKRAPMLVTAVNRYLINMLSERLLDANSKVRDLMM